MRFGKLSGRAIPVLMLGLGRAAAGDPELLPKPAEPFDAPAIVVSTPSEIPKDLPKPPTLAPLPVPPGTPVEPGPLPKEVPAKPAIKEYFPPPMPVPDPPYDYISNAVLPGMPPQPALAYARAEYLFWCLSGGKLPVLALTGPANVPIGVPGFPGDTPLFGGDYPIQDPRSGLRLTFGTWLDCTRTVGVEASGFWLNRQSTDFTAGSADGSGVIASSPYVDPTTGLPSSIAISFPGAVAGSTNINYVGRSIWGAEGLMRVLMSAGPHWRVDGLIGYRYRYYSEALTINNSIVPLAAPGTLIAATETIEAENEFHGGVLGIDCQKDFGCWTVNVRPTVAIGRMRNATIRSGSTTFTVPGTPDVILPGATYNLTSNIGEIDSQDWTVIPELDVRVSKTVWNCVRLSVGYSAMYIPLLARAGEQIDPYVNPNLIPPIAPGGPARPLPLLERSPAWLHGFTVGFEVRF